jgi:hypothetical protein
MMRKSIVPVAALAALLLISAAVWASSDVPGSLEDPVVSKSYVDAKTTFSPIEVTGGQLLIGAEGTEIILRSGEAAAIDNGENGVADLTSGTDLLTGSRIEPNHLLLIPRDDGRGITAISDVWVLVRGDYTIL